MRNGSSLQNKATDDKVPAVTKAIAIIRHLNAAPSNGAPLSQISDALKLTKSHCHNILKALAREGWLAYDETRRCYSLAPRMLGDISRLVGSRQLTTLVHEELARLSRATGTPCVLTRVERDGSFVAIDKAEEASELIVSVPIGHRFPADAPAQMRVRLAWSPDEVRKRELARWKPKAYTETTLTQKTAVSAEIEDTRQRGYAISRAEMSPGVMSLAAPIFGVFGEVQMVLQCPGLVETVAKNEARIAAELLRSTERLNGFFRSPD